MSLSVVLATFNEEKNIAKCLESVKNLADEIVIVDGSSTDSTVEIAKKYRAKVLITDNPHIFHINKQKAIDIATKDWILQLDADERVSKELEREILTVIQTHPSKNGYWIPRKNWFLGRFLMKGGQYPDYTLRLYKRGKGKLPQKDVHEQAIVEGETDYLKNPLIHIADPSFSRYVLRWNRYVNLMVDELYTKKQGGLLPLDYLFAKPFYWFFIIYLRHKGFMDSWQGLVFSFFSAARFPTAYLRFLFQKGKK